MASVSSQLREKFSFSRILSTKASHQELGDIREGHQAETTTSTSNRSSWWKKKSSTLKSPHPLK
jgi:hypothetical protein